LKWSNGFCFKSSKKFLASTFQKDFYLKFSLCILFGPKTQHHSLVHPTIWDPGLRPFSGKFETQIFSGLQNLRFTVKNLGRVCGLVPLGLLSAVRMDFWDVFDIPPPLNPL
jgi:hypothetical protein